jgi:hypothetical protein
VAVLVELCCFGSILSSLESIFLLRKYEGGYIAGPIKGLRRRNFGKR